MKSQKLIGFLSTFMHHYHHMMPSTVLTHTNTPSNVDAIGCQSSTPPAIASVTKNKINKPNNIELSLLGTSVQHPISSTLGRHIEDICIIFAPS